MSGTLLLKLSRVVQAWLDCQILLGKAKILTLVLSECVYNLQAQAVQGIKKHSKHTHTLTTPAASSIVSMLLKSRKCLRHPQQSEMQANWINNKSHRQVKNAENNNNNWLINWRQLSLIECHSKWQEAAAFYFGTVNWISFPGKACINCEKAWTIRTKCRCNAATRCCCAATHLSNMRPSNNYGCSVCWRTQVKDRQQQKQQSSSNNKCSRMHGQWV